MRTLIVNAVVIDGTGSPARSDSALVIEDHLVDSIVDWRTVYYDRAGTIVDARGGFVLPGLIDHHVHGLTRGPLMVVGEPALSDERVRANLDRLLRQGVTTALNVDGYPTTEEAIASSRFHPLTVKVSTLHTPTHLKWVADGPFPLGGLRDRHRWTIDEMLSRGSPAIGEAGPGIDPHWTDYLLIPEAIGNLGGHVSMSQARELRLAAEASDRGQVESLLAAAGLTTEQIRAEDFVSIHEATIEWRRLARHALEEAISEAGNRSVPLILHHSPATHELVVGAARDLGARVIAGHSNFQMTDPNEAVKRARAVRAHGGLVDVMSGDSFSAREFQQSPAVTFRLLKDGLVDLISTDYAGGFWDPMLLVIEKAHEAGAISLEEGVRLVTSSPADAIPALAPSRGRIASGAVADLVITEPGRLSAVREVFVSGKLVDLPRSLW